MRDCKVRSEREKKQNSTKAVNSETAVDYQRYRPTGETRPESQYLKPSFTNRRSFLRGSALVGTGLLTGCISAGSSDGGGERALTIGYQPYYSEAWSALVVKHGGLADKYLPEGYSVGNWEVALQGAVIGNRMIAGKNDIGYTGDMPSITAIANNERPISVVALAGFSHGQQCNLAIVPKGSNIESPQDLNGKTFGVTTGSCTHRFMLQMAQQEDLDYKIKDQSINTILTGIREGSLAVGFGWEPIPNKAVVQTNEARYLLTGAPYNVPDAAGIIMPDSLIENEPEVARAWLKAELEAKHIIRTDHQRTVDLLSKEKELSSYDRTVLKNCLYNSLDLNPKVDRFESVTDWESVPAAETLLKQNGPQFLKSQGFIKETPDPDRYKIKPLNQAIDNLKKQVEWKPTRE